MTRFLAPVDMSDGVYQVRLIMRDRDGHVYRESKSFVIASKTPVLRARLDKARVHAGETLRIFAQASGNARTITARLYGAMPVALRWNTAAKANTGDSVVPAARPRGKSAIHVTAEDVAHNVGYFQRCLSKFGKGILLSAALMLVGALLVRGELEPWIQHTPAGPAIGALFREAPMPAGAVPVLLPPAEARPALTRLISGAPREAILYRLRAHQDEAALDFAAAETD